ncbi:MAG TPA: hypothetical protein VF331_08185 [Polyangiales bacterium]
MESCSRSLSWRAPWASCGNDGGGPSDDDDAAAGARTDDSDDIVNTAECAETQAVCGTDHKNYRNRCDAMDAGVQVASFGSCTP